MECTFLSTPKAFPTAARPGFYGGLMARFSGGQSKPIARPVGSVSSFRNATITLNPGNLLALAYGPWFYPDDDRTLVHDGGSIICLGGCILLLIGFALARVLGSFYIFNQPEPADSYRILQRLHRSSHERFDLPQRRQRISRLKESTSVIRRWQRRARKDNAELRAITSGITDGARLVPYVVAGTNCCSTRAWTWRCAYSGMVALTMLSITGVALEPLSSGSGGPALMKQTLNVGWKSS